MEGFERLFRPRSLVVVGGGAWCEAVLAQCRKIGFTGALWAVHPTRVEVAGVKAFATLADLPGVPDAAFVGVNRNATIEVVRALSAMGAGGATCFASGFQESGDGDLHEALLAAAGPMPILGPNCYGLLNYLDRVTIWPDQHGGVAVDGGVALVTQSSNIAINLTMQARGLPLAYVVTAGNQAQQGMAEIGAALLSDPRVTALGLHIEGIHDLRAFERLAALAERLGKPVIVLKVGASEAAQAATVSHTASLAGGDAGAGALLARLGFSRVFGLPAFLEALKLAHVHGRLAHCGIASLSCSGGEASLMADAALGYGVTFPPLAEAQRDGLAEALGPLVTVVNPLDYHTFIWRDQAAMTDVFAAMTGPQIALTVIVLDFPRADRCAAADWDIAVQAIEDAARQSGRPFAVLATLPEAMPESVAIRFMEAGIAPICGIDDGLAAIAAVGGVLRYDPTPLVLPAPVGDPRVMSEAAAKQALAAYGLRVPQSVRASSPEAAGLAAERIGLPVVLKGEGLAHKSEAGAVVLGLTSPEAVREAADAMPCTAFLVEEMVPGAVAEVLMGVVLDPAHGYVLTLAAGGVLTEVLQDSRSLLVPARAEDIRRALDELALAPLLYGYRGKPPADVDALVAQALALQAYVVAHSDGLEEVELNPVLALADGAIAVDALIRRRRHDDI